MAAKSTTKRATRRTLRARFGTPEKNPHLRIIAATIGPGKAQMLALLEETGSISEAARRMGMSYLRAWQLVEALNDAFRQPLVASGTGGPRGGGSHLTPAGRQALRLYQSIRQHCQRASARDLNALHRLLKA